MNLVVWLIVTVSMLIVEGATAQLVSIWFAGGAFAAMIVAFFTDNIFIQVSVFIVVSGILLICTRPFVKKLVTSKVIKTNADGMIGKTAVIIEDVDNDSSKGTVKLNGVTWSVKSEDGNSILTGEKVIIKKIEGVKLIVGKEE